MDQNIIEHLKYLSKQSSMKLINDINNSTISNIMNNNIDFSNTSNKYTNSELTNNIESKLRDNVIDFGNNSKTNIEILNKFNESMSNLSDKPLYINNPRNDPSFKQVTESDKMKFAEKRRKKKKQNKKNNNSSSNEVDKELDGYTIDLSGYETQAGKK